MAKEAGGKHVLCVGAAVLDTLFRVADMPKGEGKVLPYEMLQIAEGMASSAAYAVHRMGGRASLWGAVGDDETGTRILRDLSESGIDTSGMTIAPGARSALSTIIIDNRGERLIVPFYDHRLHEKKRACTPADIAPFDAVCLTWRARLANPPFWMAMWRRWKRWRSLRPPQPISSFPNPPPPG